MKNLTCMAALLLVPLITFADSESGVYNEDNISLGYAMDVAIAATAACTDSGYKVSVAVLDNKGLVKAQATADGAFLHSGEAARRKAYASMSRGLPTHKIQAHIVGNNDINTALNFSSLGMSTWGGGLPIEYKGSIIGAVGVSGAPSGEADVACATKAIESVTDKYTES